MSYIIKVIRAFLFAFAFAFPILIACAYIAYRMELSPLDTAYISFCAGAFVTLVGKSFESNER